MSDCTPMKTADSSDSQQCRPPLHPHPTTPATAAVNATPTATTAATSNNTKRKESRRKILILGGSSRRGEKMRKENNYTVSTMLAVNTE